MNKKTKSVTIFIVLCSQVLFGQLGVAPVAAPPQMPSSGFYIDGFLQGKTPVGDWLAGGVNYFAFSDEGIGLIPLSILVRDKYNSSSDETFSKAFLQDDPNTMKWTLRRATSKTDLNNFLVFMALNPADNHIWIVLAADRRSAGKNSSIDLELLQNQVLMTGDINSNNDKGFYSAGPHGGRTVGDLTISITFQNSGGSFNSVEYFQWQPDAIAGQYSYFPLNPLPGSAFAATNPISIDVPFGAFGSTTYEAYTFVEAAIDLTLLIGGTGLPSDCNDLPLKTVWVKSKSNDNYDDFIPPFQFQSQLRFPVSVNYFFIDLYTSQLNTDISPNDPANYNFHWTPIGATNGTVLDPSITGSLNDYNIPNPIFTADQNYDCISYIYRVSVSPKNNPRCIVGQTDVVINSPCKIGKPINPDQMHRGEILNEAPNNDNSEFTIFPNPVKSGAAIILKGQNTPRDIHITDISGRIVQQWIGTGSNNLEVKNLSPGMYLIRSYSRSTGKTITKKLIVTK